MTSAGAHTSEQKQDQVFWLGIEEVMNKFLFSFLKVAKPTFAHPCICTVLIVLLILTHFVLTPIL